MTTTFLFDDDTREHTMELAVRINELVTQYVEREPGSDINDVLSALSVVLTMLCKQNDVPQVDMLRNIGMMYEQSYDAGAIN